jgi:hypothetical protein
MGELSRHIDALLAFLHSIGLYPPASKVKIVEINQDAPTDPMGRFRVRRDAFRDPPEYEARFDQLMSANPAWVNISCYGADGDSLIVVVELPRPSYTPASRTASSQTAINYSGPTNAVLRGGWKLGEVLAIE